MKRLIFLSVLLIISLFIHGLTYGHRNSSPNMECINCHAGELVQDMIKLEGLPQRYIPEKTYNLKIVLKTELESMSESKGGFSLEVTGGKLIVKDKRHTQLSNGFLTHTQEGNELRTWEFAWKAPSERMDISFTVMAVAANGDYSPVGDMVGATVYVVKPAR
jgi:hypothetical protein